MKETSSEPRVHDSGLVPPWCEWGRGGSRILLVAPHGGRRPRVDATAPPPKLRVNDVYTPEITRELAAVLDAGFVINRGMDRNVLDLNRISQIRKQAPWFLELLLQEIDRIITMHGCVELIFVHGWNTGQATCDLGIGAIDLPSGLHVPNGAHMTINDVYRRQRIEPLRAACTRAHIRAPIGERYPGSHRNNVLQLFTPRAAQIDHPCTRRIATWVTDGRINALQLELGIPLRWPGPWRSKFVAAAAEAFGTQGGGPSAAAEPCRAAQSKSLPTEPAMPTALQFYDSTSDIGVVAGLGHARRDVASGRMLLFLGGQRVALFTGEEVHPEGPQVGPLRMLQRDDELRLDFDGPMLVLDDGADYLDLEAALALSRLVAVQVGIVFRPSPFNAGASPARFGVAQGYTEIGGQRREVHAGAFANAAAFRASGACPQTMLAATFGNERGVLTRVVDGSGENVGTHFTHSTPEALNALRIAVVTDGDLYTPHGFELSCDGLPPLRAQAVSRMAILRPAGHAGYMRVTFGVARFEWGGDIGHGLYEYVKSVTSDE